MPFSGLLDTLRTRAARRHESAADCLWAAAKRLAAGESASPDTVEAALADAGLQVADFDKLVDLAQQRREWFAAVDRAEPARVRRDKVVAALEKDRIAFEEARRRWQEKTEAADAELKVLERTVREGEEARETLCNPANLPAGVADRMQAALDAQQAANVRVGDVQRALRQQRDIRQRRLWMADQKRTEGKCHPLDIEDDERLAKRAERRIAELETQAREAAEAVRLADDNVKACRTAALKT